MAAARAAAADWPDSRACGDLETWTRNPRFPGPGGQKNPGPMAQDQDTLYEILLQVGPDPRAGTRLRVKFAESDCHWFKFQAT